MNDHDKILSGALDFLRDEVFPRANEIDRDTEALRWALDGLCSRNVMALRRPEEFGGPGLPEPMFREFQEGVARYSGSLAFLQTQHQTAGNMIAKGAGLRLKQDTLPLMADGKRLIGIGFSQLRRPGPPLLTARHVDGGYVLDGTVPWVTGMSFYHEFLVGAALPSGEAVFGVVPLTPTKQEGGSITFSEPMRLAAIESPQTVSAHFEHFLLPDEHTAFIKPAGWIRHNDMINITLQGFFALGCARAGLDQLEFAMAKKRSAFIVDAHAALTKELDDCKARTIALQQTGDEEEPTEEKLKARAWAIDLCVRCAHAGVAANSGAANSLNHHAQRVYREALVYTVSAQTEPVMEATLRRLSARR